jgi:hypothetical protein
LFEALKEEEMTMGYTQFFSQGIPGSQIGTEIDSRFSEVHRELVLNGRYLTALLNGFDKVLRAADHLLAQSNPAAAESEIRSLKGAVEDARIELDHAKAAKP